MTFLARQSGYIHIHVTWAGGKFCSITRGERERERESKAEGGRLHKSTGRRHDEGRKVWLFAYLRGASWHLGPRREKKDGKKEGAQRGKEIEREQRKWVYYFSFGVCIIHSPVECVHISSPSDFFSRPVVPGALLSAFLFFPIASTNEKMLREHFFYYVGQLGKLSSSPSSSLPDSGVDVFGTQEGWMAHDGLQMGYRFYTRGQGQESPANWDEKTAEGEVLLLFFFSFLVPFFLAFP